MKRIIQYSLLFLLILFTASSCKKSVPNQTKYIPKDAMLVFDLNWKSLSDKARKGSLNWDSLFMSMQNNPEELATGKNKFNAFMQSGVDTESHVFFFVKSGGSIMNGQSTTGGVIAALKDAGKFENYIKQQSGTTINKADKFSYASFSHNMYAGWNKDIVILTGGAMSSGNNAPAASPSQLLTTLFTQKEDESVASIPEFREQIGQQADMLMWTNTSSMFNSIPLLGLTKIADLFKNSYTGSIVNFEDGKAAGTFTSYINKDLGDIFKKYGGPVTDMDMVNRFPYPVSGFTAFSFNPELLAEIVRYGGLEGTVSQFLDKEGFTMQDITKAFKGDFAIVFSDLGMTEKELTYGGETIKMQQPSAKLIFNATIADAAAYNKIVKSLAAQGIMQMQNGQYVPAGFANGFVWNMNGKNLLVASDSLVMQQYLAGKGNAALPADISSKAKGKSVAMYFDISKILQSYPGDSAAAHAMNAAKATLSNGLLTADNYNAQNVKGDFELNTVNKNENSFVALIKFFASVSGDLKAEGKKLHRESVDNDSEDNAPQKMPEQGY